MGCGFVIPVTVRSEGAEVTVSNQKWSYSISGDPSAGGVVITDVAYAPGAFLGTYRDKNGAVLHHARRGIQSDAATEPPKPISPDEARNIEGSVLKALGVACVNDKGEDVELGSVSFSSEMIRWMAATAPKR